MRCVCWETGIVVPRAPPTWPMVREGRGGAPLSAAPTMRRPVEQRGVNRRRRARTARHRAHRCDVSCMKHEGAQPLRMGSSLIRRAARPRSRFCLERRSVHSRARRAEASVALGRDDPRSSEPCRMMQDRSRSRSRVADAADRGMVARLSWLPVHLRRARARIQLRAEAS